MSAAREFASAEAPAMPAGRTRVPPAVVTERLASSAPLLRILRALPVLAGAVAEESPVRSRFPGAQEGVEVRPTKQTARSAGGQRAWGDQPSARAAVRGGEPWAVGAPRPGRSPRRAARSRTAGRRRGGCGPGRRRACPVRRVRRRPGEGHGHAGGGARLDGADDAGCRGRRDGHDRGTRRRPCPSPPVTSRTRSAQVDRRRVVLIPHSLRRWSMVSKFVNTSMAWPITS